METALKRIRSMRKDYLLKFVCLVMTDLLPSDAMRPWDPKWAGEAKTSPEAPEDPILRCRICNADGDTPAHFWQCPGLGSEREDRLRDCLTRADQWSADCDLSVEGRRGIQSLVRIILVPAAQQRDKDPTIRNWPPELFNIGLFPSAWYQALRTFATLHNPDASPRAKKKSPEWLGHVILDSILDSGFGCGPSGQTNCVYYGLTHPRGTTWTLTAGAEPNGRKLSLG